MIHIIELRLPVDHPPEALSAAIVTRLGIPVSDLLKIDIFKRSYDARKNIALSDAKSVMDAQGLDGDTSTPAELGNLVKGELVKWAGVIKMAGIKAE